MKVGMGEFMEVIDAGHKYKLKELDANEGQDRSVLTFVKRCDPPEKYPGNSNSYPGTTIQEVLRALIDRCKYVDNQIPCYQTKWCITLFRNAIWLLEKRAAERHRRTLVSTKQDIENEPTCNLCGHIQCEETCHQTK